MSWMRRLRDWLAGCPQLCGKTIEIEYTAGNFGECTLHAVPERAVIRRYADGGSLKRFVFTISVADGFHPGSDGPAALEVIEDWIRAQEESKTLPVLPDGREAMNIWPQEPAVLDSNTADRAVYSQKYAVLYFESGVKR